MRMTGVMPKAPKLDRIDLKILSALQSNGRITNAALADAVGLSQSPCLQRVKRLEEAGYISARDHRGLIPSDGSSCFRWDQEQFCRDGLSE